MALNFTNTTDRVTVTSTAAMTGNATWSVLLWVRPTSLVNQARIFHKGLDPNERAFYLNGTGGNLEIDFGRGTAGAGNVGTIVTNNTPLSTTNKWYCVAATGDSGGGAGNIMHIYVGSLTAALVEATYGTKTDGVGTVPSDSGAAAIIGNRSTANVPWQGDIASCQFICGASLSLGQLLALQFAPHVIASTQIAVQLGYNGTSSQIDWSGNQNNGTCTGTTQVKHVPLGKYFGGSVGA